MTQKRKHYETPQLTVAEFKTERGYAVSQRFIGSIFMMGSSSWGSTPAGTSELETRTNLGNAGWSTEFNN